MLVLQSPRLGRESWLLCFVCLPGVSLLLSAVCDLVFPDHTSFFANSLDPDQDRQNVDPDLDLNRLTLIACPRDF